MERTVPRTASEEIELYLRTYYSLLRSTAEVQIRTLEEAHAGMNSLLHPGARSEIPDIAALIYSILRLPLVAARVQLVILGQSLEVFERGGWGNVEAWEPVSAPARRRKCYFDGDGTLACFIASRTDIDDIIPILTAYQIEWNKFNALLSHLPATFDFSELATNISQEEYLADILQISWEDLQRLRAAWGDDYLYNLELMASQRRRTRVQLLNGSLSEYRRATNLWWDNIEKRCPVVTEKPVYFISSNTHSVANVLSGFALRYQDQIVEFLQESENAGLLNEWRDIERGRIPSSKENFLYYVLRKYLGTSRGRSLLAQQEKSETEMGLYRIPSEHSFDVEAQVIDLSRLKPEWFDPRLRDSEDFSFLLDSDAYIVNIDYPLGLAAYNILSQISDSVGKVLGIFVIGKAASLNAVIGDVMIPNVVYDEHSQNTYIFPNGITAADVTPYITYGSVLDNQKAVSVLGTFLQNMTFMDVFYREGYTDIEMESGPYLSAIYEMYRPQRHPTNEIVNFYNLPFDLGVIHYASDTPLGKGKNLGAGNLSYYGVDSTYSAILAVIRRVLRLEKQRLKS